MMVMVMSDCFSLRSMRCFFMLEARVHGFVFCFFRESAIHRAGEQQHRRSVASSGGDWFLYFVSWFDPASLRGLELLFALFFLLNTAEVAASHESSL
jgi:hypothetical protein